jgi:hypothetical protein
MQKDVSRCVLRHRFGQHSTARTRSSRARSFLGAMAGVVFLFSSASALAQFRVDLAPEYYYWHEKNPATGGKFLDESGLRMGLEASYKPAVEAGWLWAARAKLYVGSVDYNGGLQSSAGFIAKKDTTKYLGGLVEAGYGYRSRIGDQHFLDIMGRVGVDYWSRDLPSSDDLEFLSYNETFLPVYLKLGVDLRPRTESGWIAAFGLKRPVYIRERIIADIDEIGATTVRPTPKLSGYAETGYQFTRQLSVIAFVDSYRFGASDLVDVGFTSIQQPETYTYSAGIKVSWAF